MKKHSIGIDLGGTKILIALVNKETGEVLFSVKKKTKKDKGPKKILQKMVEGVKEVLELSGFGIEQMDSIGIGAAGQVDRQNGILISAPNLNCFDLNLKEILETEFGLPVFLGNDVEIAALGELKFGAGRGYKDFICVFVGTGIGSAIVINEEIYRGATGTAGEFGHIIVDLNGRTCGCGAHGCLEAYASRSAIEKRIVGALKKGRASVISEFIEDGKISSSMIKKSIEAGDELVTQSVLEASEYLSGGLASIINFANPELIILGGGVIDAVDYFYEKTIEKARMKSLPVPARAIAFKKAELGDFSGVVGAALLQS